MFEVIAIVLKIGLEIYTNKSSKEKCSKTQNALIKGNSSKTKLQTPKIEFTSVPLKGTRKIFIEGIIKCPKPLDISDCWLTACVKFDGIWYGAKPNNAKPLTKIETDGSFRLQFATSAENNDIYTSEIAIFLVNQNIEQFLKNIDETEAYSLLSENGIMKWEICRDSAINSSNEHATA
jgi:hypothetical protein